MYTYQMVGLADQNGRTYESKYGVYDKQNGFIINPRYAICHDLINNLFHEDCWVLKVEKPKPKKMTKEEIEKELGYEIEIEESEKNKDDEYKKDLISFLVKIRNGEI